MCLFIYAFIVAISVIITLLVLSGHSGVITTIIFSINFLGAVVITTVIIVVVIIVAVLML